MRYKVIIPILSILFLVTGCASASVPEVKVSSEMLSSKEAAETPEDPVKPESDPETGSMAVSSGNMSNDNELSGVELAEFTRLFATLEYRGFLEEPFNDPHDINWDVILDRGAGVCKTDIGEKEVSEYLSLRKSKRLYTDLLVITEPELKDFIKTHAGIEFDRDNTIFSWLYIEDRDSFYHESWYYDKDYEGRDYKCIAGEKAGDRYILRFQLISDKHYGADADRILTLSKSGDNLIMESNEIQWDDNCDESQTFDINLSQYDGPVRFVTYLCDSEDGTRINLIKDGRLLQIIEGGEVWRNGGRCKLQKVLDVSFFDYNADGEEDIVIIGDTEKGNVLILEESIQGYFLVSTYVIFYYTSFYRLVKPNLTKNRVGERPPLLD